MSFTTLGYGTRRLDQRRGACALIAIKERSRCKSRLAEVLAPAARARLVRTMLASALSAAAAAQTVRQIIVLSPERDAVPAEIPVLADNGRSLNGALTQAYQVLREFGCREVVILPADLPTIGATDIDTLVRAGRRGGFAIAPDAAGSGTNALYLVTAQPFRFRYGPDSKRLHLQEAQRSGLRPRVIRRPGLEFDVDWPDDLSRLDEQPWRHQA